MKKLDGKVAIVTGGNGGIGKATARLLVREGAQVVITGRRRDALDQAVAELGAGVLAISGNVEETDHHASVAREVEKRFGRLDIYVANAGVINITPTADVSPEEFDRQFSVNARGTFFGVQSVLPLLRENGSITLVGSIASRKVLDNHAVYAGTKAAIAAFARNWTLELRERGIRVNVVSPGPTQTPVLHKLGVSEEKRPALLKAMSEMIPAGRMGEPEEIAEAILFLATDEGRFINGVELRVDGGMSLV